MNFRRIFYPASIPLEYRSNFLHLYQDIGWFGILSGSSVSFLTVYATRLGASGFQIGLLGAVAAIVSLFLAIPAGRWLEHHKIEKAVFWSSIWYRIGFLLWVPLPWIFGKQAQVWALIILNLMMAIPLTPLSVGFNAVFASAVPADWRAHVAGVRNILLSVAFILSSLVSGYLLEHLPFPIGYQVVFGIGFLGAAMSSYHLYFVKPLQIGFPTPPADPQSAPVKVTRLSRASLHASIRFDIWKTPFRNTLLVFLAFHLTQYLALPLFPLFQVRQLGLNDNQIGTGTAIFYLSVLIGSTQLSQIARKLGHHKATSFGVMGFGFYPFLLALSKNVFHFYLTSAVGGLIYAVLIGSYANYLLERIPEHDRPAHLAWYNIILNASILIGALTGPLIAHWTDLITALIIIAMLRFVSGLVTLKWG